jgi:protein TonB
MIVLLCVLRAEPVQAQEIIRDTVTVEEIFILLEPMPAYPGGEEARIKFLQENLVYPTMAREAGISGEVLISFVVEPNGHLTDFSVIRSVAPVLDEEALRVAKLMPNWKPGKLRGKAVRVQFQLPITFTLNDSIQEKDPIEKIDEEEK